MTKSCNLVYLHTRYGEFYNNWFSIIPDVNDDNANENTRILGRGYFYNLTGLRRLIEIQARLHTSDFKWMRANYFLIQFSEKMHIIAFLNFNLTCSSNEDAIKDEITFTSVVYYIFF